MARGDLKTMNYYPFNAGLKLFNNSTDTFKLAIVTNQFSTVDVNFTDPALSDYTDSSTGGNYTAGGNALPGNAWTISSAVSKLDFTDFAMVKAAGNPSAVKTALIINATAGSRVIHAIDLTTDGSTSVNLVNSDLAIAFNADGTFTATVTA
ncbi:hypothetical protein JLT2_73 [Paraglaciecola Antarctic JLT virus 2]|nr:hypothetical protein JLT2_73 [Paraglaciecola Antarctic JLT virus 2]